MIEEQNECDLPNGWNLVKLGDLCEKISNGANAKQVEEQVGYPISRIETIWNETIDLERVKYVHENDPTFVEKYALKESDILFSHINSDVHLGKTAIYKNQVPVLIHGINLLLIRLKKSVSADFINYQFKYKRKQGEFIRIAQKSVNQSSINQAKLKNLDFVVPPLDVQQQIVSKTEELFSELDKGIEELKTAQQQLKVYRQAVLKWAFEGKLTNENVKEGELPEGWELREIKSVCSNIKVGIVIKPTQFYSTSEAGVKAFRSANVREFKINDSDWVYFSEEGNEINYRTKLKEGDVLLVRSGYPGTSCVVSKKFEGSNAIDILIATPNKEIITSEYLCCFNNSPLGKGLFRSNSRGVAQKHLNVGQYSRLKISVPPIEEQQQIVQEIESRLSVCDKIEETINNAFRQAEVMRQSILKHAFAGFI